MRRFLWILLDRSVRSILPALVLFCGVAAFGHAATRDLGKVRIGDSGGGLIPIPVIVAQENRVLEQAGFDVELINIPPTIAVTALISGDIQYVIFAGTTLNAAFRSDNVFAAQFHPEKSSTPGLQMLSNFVDVCAAAPVVV